MSGVTVLSANPALEQSLVDDHGKSVAIRRVWSDQWRDPVEIVMDACAANPELLVIGSDVDGEMGRAVVADVDRRYPSTTTVVLTPVIEQRETIELLRLGARDVVIEAPGTEAFRETIGDLLSVARARHDRSSESGGGLRRRVITVVSPKGGSGKTTMATNLAVGLARRLPKQVLLLDLDLQFGDCAAALSLRPEHSLTNAIGASMQERTALKVFLSAHPSGLLVLPPPDDLVAVDDIEADQLKRTVGALTEEFPFVVIDTGGGIDTAAMTAMELSTDLLLVTTTDVPAITAIRRQLEALDAIGFTSQRRILVLNRANAKVGLSVSDVEATIGLEVAFEIPSSRIVPVSTNEGTPAILKDAGNVAKRYEEVAAYFAPPEDRASRSLLRAIRKDR